MFLVGCLVWVIKDMSFKVFLEKGLVFGFVRGRNLKLRWLYKVRNFKVLYF